MNITQDNSKARRQFTATKVSIYASITLFLISAVIGIAIDSITLILDASASLVILFVAFLMNFSLKKINSPPDRIYNFGYGKYEPFTVVIQSILIIVTCVISIKFAVQDIIHPDDAHSYGLPTVAMLISGIIGVFVSVYLNRVSKLTNSAMLKAASMHWRADTVLSFGVCLGFLSGFILQGLGYARITPYVDPVMAIILGLILMAAPLKDMGCYVLELLDAVPEENIQNKVRIVVEKYTPHSFGVERLRSRKSGESIFVDVCFIVRDDMTVQEIRRLADNFEADLRKHLPHCDVVVYFRTRTTNRA